jgi:hypothetical protein
MLAVAVVSQMTMSRVLVIAENALPPKVAK